MVDVTNTISVAMQPVVNTQVPASTASLDLPPAIASLLNMGAIESPMQIPSTGISGNSYQMGGQVGPGGQPVLPPGMGAQPQMPMGAAQPPINAHILRCMLRFPDRPDV